MYLEEMGLSTVDTGMHSDLRWWHDWDCWGLSCQSKIAA